MVTLKEELKNPINKLKEIELKINKISNTTTNGQSKTEILKFQIDEIENADIKQGEEENLLQLKKQVSNAEKIINSLSDNNNY